jgi:phage-related protein
MYNMTSFDFTGDPAVGLTDLLNGTPFTAGAVEFTGSVTMKINQEVSRRAALMQYIAILGGEIEYNGYNINIRSHRGSNTYKQVMDTKNVTSVAVSHDSRENASSYDISFFKLLNLAVGDNVQIVFTPLGINVKTRIISLEYNPFYRYHIKVEVGGYKPSISDTFYRLENSISNVGSSVNDIQTQVNDLGVSYTIVSDIVVSESTINVTYAVENGAAEQYHANYSYTVDDSGRITSITLNDIFSELLLKEVSQLTVGSTNFDIVYADYTTATYNYTTDASGRITSVTKV